MGKLQTQEKVMYKTQSASNFNNSQNMCQGGTSEPFLLDFITKMLIGNWSEIPLHGLRTLIHGAAANRHQEVAWSDS